jgi:hypothetical protein
MHRRILGVTCSARRPFLGLCRTKSAVGQTATSDPFLCRSVKASKAEIASLANRLPMGLSSLMCRQLALARRHSADRALPFLQGPSNSNISKRAISPSGSCQRVHACNLAVREGQDRENASARLDSHPYASVERCPGRIQPRDYRTIPEGHFRAASTAWASARPARRDCPIM